MPSRSESRSRRWICCAMVLVEDLVFEGWFKFEVELKLLVVFEDTLLGLLLLVGFEEGALFELKGG